MSEFIKKLRHWSYDRQLLGKQGESLTQVLKDVIGVYSWHPTAPLALMARVKDFKEADFYDLDLKKKALRIPAMRLSNYMLDAETAGMVFRATIPPVTDPVWEKRYSMIPSKDYEGWRKDLIEFVKKPMTSAEIRQIIGIPDEMIKPVINRLCFEGTMLRIGAKSLRSNIISYVSTKHWMADGLKQKEENEQSWLAGEYLRAFGPARIKDFQWWAGITAGAAKTAIHSIETEDIGNGYLLLKKDHKKFEAFKIQERDTIDILPQWDSYTMGYAPDGRERFVSKDMQHHLYGDIGATGGNGLGMILINGEAHGSWEFKFAGTKMVVKLNMFEKVGAKSQTAINSKLEEVANLLKAKSLVIEQK